MFRRVVVTLAVLALLAPCAAMADPPAESGPYVVRYEGSPDWAGWFFADAKRGYLVFVAWNPIEFCTVGGGFDIINIQEVQNPQNENQINVLAKMDDAYAAVWEWAPGTPVTCAFVLETPTVGVGTVDGVYTDNDLFAGDDLDEERANSWHLSVHGVVMNDMDESFNLNAGFHCTWTDRYGPASCKTKVNVK